MEHKLFASMAFALCAFIYLTFVLVIYISKRRKKTVSKAPFANFFPFLLIFNMVMGAAEVFYILTMTVREAHPVLCETACRIYIFIGSVWLTNLLFYVWTISQRKETDILVVKKKSRKVGAALSALLVVSTTISLMGDIYYSPYRNDFYVFGGPASNSVYIIGSVVATAVIIAMIIKGINIEKRLKRPVYFSFGFIMVLFSFQLILNVDYNILTFIYAFIISTLFFTYESQDYQMMHELEEKRVQAEQADKAKTKFLSNISHSIRTPMTTILGQSDLMLMENNLTKENTQEGISDINVSGNQLLSLIDNILDVSTIESGKETINEKEYKLENLIYEVNSLIHSKIKNASIDYTVHVDQNIPSKLYGDYPKLLKILTCILSNAINYTNFGNIDLNIRGVLVDNHMELVFKIANSGHEMEQQNFDKDLDELGEDDSDSFVNLYIIIARRLIKMLDGTIEFINETGKGTQYIVKLNQKIIDFTPIGDILDVKNVQNIHRKRPNLSGKNILIVDDNPINLKLTKRLMSSFNAKLTTASSGQECLDLVKKNKYDIIFLDHMMPEMDGITTMKLLKDVNTNLPPVIALTANQVSDSIDEYLQAGFSDYLAKPINNGDLIRLMVKYFVTEEGRN